MTTTHSPAIQTAPRPQDEAAAVSISPGSPWPWRATSSPAGRSAGTSWARASCSTATRPAKRWSRAPTARIWAPTSRWVRWWTGRSAARTTLEIRLRGALRRHPAGDKIPPGARVPPTRARRPGGSSVAFNGETPLFPLPGIPGADESELVYESHFRGTRATDPWVATSNGVDFQHLRTLHGWRGRSGRGHRERLPHELSCGRARRRPGGPHHRRQHVLPSTSTSWSRISTCSSPARPSRTGTAWASTSTACAPGTGAARRPPPPSRICVASSSV
jgi:hypothetical protein